MAPRKRRTSKKLVEDPLVFQPKKLQRHASLARLELCYVDPHMIGVDLDGSVSTVKASRRRRARIRKVACGLCKRTEQVHLLSSE